MKSKNRYYNLKVKVLWNTLLWAFFITVGISVVYSLLGIWDLQAGIMREMAEVLEGWNAPYRVVDGVNKVANLGTIKRVWYLWHCILFATYVYFSSKTAVTSLEAVTQGVVSIHKKENQDPVVLPYGLEYVEDTLNRIKIELKDIEIKAAESKKRQNEIVMFLAHDLKTPLTSVVAYLSMLEQQKDMGKKEREKYIGTALDKSIRLGELINEFFEITKYNLQDIKLEKEIFDVSMMLEQIADEFYGVMSEKGLECYVKAEEGLIINGDTDKLARVFENILRNAVNYCHEDSQVRIQARDIGDFIEIILANQGDQIPQEKLFTIFEKFYRLDDARSSVTGGSGLGLAISKEIIELHEGVIFAESDESETRFVIHIPKLKESEY